MKVGYWFDNDHDHPGALVILAAHMNGWDGLDPEEPDTDIVAMAIRELFEDKELTGEECDKLVFRWPGYATQWLNTQVEPFGHKFGWSDGVFYLQTDEFWEERGGPDQMWLP